jgi:hypothetical protein
MCSFYLTLVAVGCLRRRLCRPVAGHSGEDRHVPSDFLMRIRSAAIPPGSQYGDRLAGDYGMAESRSRALMALHPWPQSQMS